MHASVTLTRGKTYIFDVSFFGNAHPFRLSTTEDGTFNGGVTYSEGVEYTSTTVTWTVPEDFSFDTMYYYCTLHRAMAGDGVINIVD